MKQRRPTIAHTVPDESPFQRFAKAMRALVAVPKRELDKIVAKGRAEKRLSAKSR